MFLLLGLAYQKKTPIIGEIVKKNARILFFLEPAIGLNWIYYILKLNRYTTIFKRASN